MSSTADKAAAPDRFWSVDEHLDDILGKIRPLEPIELQLLDAQGCVLVEDVTVPADLPGFDNSSMDGYAVRTTDVEGASEEFPAVLTVIGDVAAGSGELPTVGHGEAARIMTGAPLPPGAEAVVPVEWTDGGTGGGPAAGMAARSAAPDGASGEVRIHRPAVARAHVRAAGSDVAAGALALRTGTVLGPPQIGLLAAIGRATVRVRPRPRVVIMSTGSELVAPGESLGPGLIHDSNSYVLTACARDAGAIAYRVGAVADDADTLRSTLEDQLVRADAVVTSGGVSVGAYDVVKETLSELAGEEGSVDFRKLAMQPGKPQGFGRVGPDRTPLLALPGNPVSAYVSFELFVRPAIRALMGLEPHDRETVRAVCAEAVASSPEGRRQFLRARYADGKVTTVGGPGSHLVKALAEANALIVVPEETTAVEVGAEVDVILLG
ncbi:molybdotransferase-like divisome protein Glp [Streptomyces netropsis]|uniref:Molybdopterin molybdenumtransferase n=1 Tax=Streptomyces netropsis TaxID=55404 RepID=A0A7W7LBI3_STRNE|nr:gephyrin-like molybdotransferase Glp [Streptomyces netropsis]MBB4886979.1 molybdopterin molybdotransferase [Streptomyces netropsis]GGR24648.1 molybdopterin molybdenumtransferase MoeA [Streptomyces netropsis]